VVKTSSLAFLPIEAADTFIMVDYRCTGLWVSIMHDQKLFTLRWCWLFAGGSDIVAAIFSHIWDQNFNYIQISLHSCLVIKDEWTRIIDPVLMLFRKIYSNDVDVGIFGVKAGQCCNYVLQWPCLLFDYQSHNTKNHWRIVDAHFQDWSTSVSLCFLPIKTANTMALEGCDYAAVCMPKM